MRQRYDFSIIYSETNVKKAKSYFLSSSSLFDKLFGFSKIVSHANIKIGATMFKFKFIIKEFNIKHI